MIASVSYGEGSIFRYKVRRGERTYRYHGAELTVDGRRVRVSDKTRDGVKAKLRALQAHKDAGTVDRRLMTLGQFLDGWLADVRGKLAPATWRKHESIVRVHLAPHLGRIGLSRLSVADVQSYLGQLEVGPQTRRHHRATLRRALNDAVREGLVTRNVAALAEAPKMTARERAVLTADDCRALIDGTRDDPLWAFYVLAVTTGMRSAELLGLTWEDIDLGDRPDHLDDRRRSGAHGRSPRDDDDDHADVSQTGAHADLDVRGFPVRADQVESRGTRVDLRDHTGSPRLNSGAVHVRHTLQRIDGEWQLRAPKTPKSRRVIPLPPITVEALRAHRATQLTKRAAVGRLGPDGLVFTTPTGHPIHGTNLLPELYRHEARLRLPKVGIHGLRHSTATVLFGLGVPLEAIADILGHSTTRVTADLYRHHVPQLSRDAAQRLQEAFG